MGKCPRKRVNSNHPMLDGVAEGLGCQRSEATSFHR